MSSAAGDRKSNAADAAEYIRLDRISAAALGSRTLDELLRNLLRALAETMPAIDTAVILLREGDVLRARAAVGLGEDVARGFTLRPSPS